MRSASRMTGAPGKQSEIKKHANAEMRHRPQGPSPEADDTGSLQRGVMKTCARWSGKKELASQSLFVSLPTVDQKKGI